MLFFDKLIRNVKIKSSWWIKEKRTYQPKRISSRQETKEDMSKRITLSHKFFQSFKHVVSCFHLVPKMVKIEIVNYRKLVFLQNWMKTLSQVSPNIQRYISNNPPCCAPPIYSSIRYWEILETREGEIQFCFWRNRVFGMFLLEAGDAGWWEAPPVGSPTPQRPQLFPPKALKKPP